MLSGHSFGGISAIVSAARLPENVPLKAVQALDPWLYPYQDEFKSG